jgi:uncharacterized lipoprotein YddW (UPF0748 family)
MRSSLLAGLALLAAPSLPLAGQTLALAMPETTVVAFDADSLPPVAREFRGVWVASVANIDWPSRPGLTSEQQQLELLAILDRAAALRLNAVVLQVRPAGDALYASSLEPWSEYLTGVQGEAPSPYYDPLEFAVEEAHRRGLELHAWFNPFRARADGAKSPPARTHISRTRPELVRTYGRMKWMDPGEGAVREHSLRVILDVVRRYDIDGVHIDDYFYPYREWRNGRPVPFPDAASWRRYRREGGTLSRDDWRRSNVDRFVRLLYERVKAEKRWVKVGISPFGIWRPGHPEGITGLDPYEQLYADSRRWLRNGWADYFTPQLYWPTWQAAQSYGALLDWWASQNVRGRHLWPGNFTNRVGEVGPKGWRADELLTQIALTRAQDGATGNVHFSMRTLLANLDSVSDRLAEGPYLEPALVPATTWLGGTAPAMPEVRAEDAPVPGAVTVMLSPGGKERPRLWVVRARLAGAWTTAILSGEARTHDVVYAGGDAPEVIGVMSVDRLGNVSAPAVVRRAEVGGERSYVE